MDSKNCGTFNKEPTEKGKTWVLPVPETSPGHCTSVNNMANHPDVLQIVRATPKKQNFGQQSETADKKKILQLGILPTLLIQDS